MNKGWYTLGDPNKKKPAAAGLIRRRRPALTLTASRVKKGWRGGAGLSGEDHMRKHRLFLLGLAAALACAFPAAAAEKKYGPGASDTEIKIGNTMPYSGPLSTAGTIGRVEAAYFQMLNERGGVNGRKI